jgi:hypothetical protein
MSTVQAYLFAISIMNLPGLDAGALIVEDEEMVVEGQEETSKFWPSRSS